MRSRRLALPLLLLAAAPAAAQRITSADPNRLVTVPATEISSVRKITLHGTGITPFANGHEFAARLRVQARRDAGEWRELRPSGWTSNQVSADVRGAEWLAVPGTLEMRLQIDGNPTNGIPIQVVAASTAAPEIREMVPSRFRPGQGRDDVYLFYVRGSRYSEPTTITVGGHRAAVGRLNVDANEALIYLPNELRNRPGRYPVVVTTRAGASLAKYVDVMGPPTVAAVEPGEIVKEKAGSGTNVRVRVRFDGAAPTSARVGSDELGWVAVAAQEWADSPTAVWIDVPMTMIAKAAPGAPKQIQIVLTNDAGSSTGTLTARTEGMPVLQRINPPSGVARPVPTVRQPPPVVRPPRRP